MSGELRFPRINNIVLSGRLTRDAELRYTSKGTPVAKIPLAFNRVYKGRDGEWVEDSNFIDVTAWNKIAEMAAEQLHKGSPIIVEGYLKTRTFVNKDNKNVKIVEVNAMRVHQLEKTDIIRNKKQNVNMDKESVAEPKVTDDDVPF